ncbi:hypothetical protein pb186bvf_014329 [Paramecium bursaria]
MSQNLDQKNNDAFNLMFNDLVCACPRRNEVKSLSLYASIEHHTTRSIFGFCSNAQCQAQSRKVCDYCIYYRIHKIDPGFDLKYILFEDQVNRIIELYKDKQIQDIQKIQDSLSIKQVQDGDKTDQTLQKKLEQYSTKVINLSTYEYIQQVDDRNLNLRQYLEENYTELETIKSEYNEQFQQNNDLEDGNNNGFYNKEIGQENIEMKGKDLLKEVFESQVYRENLVSKEDRQVIDRNVETVLQYSLEQLSSNKVSDAIEICDTVIENCNTNIQALINKGMCLDKQCKYQEALQMFDQAIHMNPNYYESHFRKGITFNHMQEYQQAIEQYKVALQLQPLSYQIHSKLANVYIKMNQYSKANRILERGQNIMNKSIKICLQVRKLYDKEQTYKAKFIIICNHFPPLQYFYLIEKQKYDKAIQLQPQYYFAFERKAQYLKQMNTGKLESEPIKNDIQNKNLSLIKRIENLKLIIIEKMHNNHLKKTLKFSLIDINQESRSLIWENFRNLNKYQKLQFKMKYLLMILLFSNNQVFWINNIGVICMRLDLPNESLLMIDRAIDIDNNDHLSYKYKGFFLNIIIGKALIMLGQYEQAQETFNIAEKQGYNANSLLKYRGIILQEANKLNEAIQILIIQSFKYLIQLQKGIVYLKQQKYDDAIKLFNKVIEQDNNNYLVYQQKGIALMKEYKYDESITNFDKSLELKPDNLTNLKLKGISLFKLSRFSDAIKIFQQAFEFDPNDTEIQNCMGNIYGNQINQLKNQQNIKRLLISIPILQKTIHQIQIFTLVKVVPFQLQLGNTLILMQQYGKAIQTFQQAKIIDPKQFELDCSIEYCYYKASQDKDRRIYFKDLIQRNIRQLSRLKLYAKSLVSLKEQQFASLIYKMIWQIYPEDEELQFYDKHLKKTEKNYPFKMKQK